MREMTRSLMEERAASTRQARSESVTGHVSEIESVFDARPASATGPAKSAERASLTDHPQRRLASRGRASDGRSLIGGPTGTRRSLDSRESCLLDASAARSPSSTETASAASAERPSIARLAHSAEVNEARRADPAPRTKSAERMSVDRVGARLALASVTQRLSAQDASLGP